MVLELGVLDYCRNKINSILFLCLFVDNPKKKFTRYSSLMSSSTIEIKKKKKLKKKSFFYKMVLKPGILEYCVAWYSSLPSPSTT